MAPRWRRWWRDVSLWWMCCVSAVFFSWCVVGGTGLQELQGPVQSPVPSQDFSPEEASVEVFGDHEVVDRRVSLLSSPSSPSENTLMSEETQQNHNPETRDKDGEYSQASETLSLTVETTLQETSPQSTSEPGLQSNVTHENLESSVIRDQDSAALLPSSELLSGFSVQPKDRLQENIPKDSPPRVLENTANAHTSGTKTLAEPPSTSSVAPSETNAETKPSITGKEQEQIHPVGSDTDSTASGGKTPEGMPTFDEWTRKMMEVEKEKTSSMDAWNSGGSHKRKKPKKNLKNYASVECGAKILGANQQATGTSSLLNGNMDLYMLIACSYKMWFIVELCEPIQLTKLDMGNLELFSSNPKDFVVSVSDRYPTNKWLKLGLFQAKNERTVQSYPLEEHLFAKYVKMFTKYIKVQQLSYYGSEYFCPLSAIRVFGTSMVEDYEDYYDPSDDDDDDMDDPGYAPGEVQFFKNLFVSAKDTVLNIVDNITAFVFGEEPETKDSVGENVFEPPVKEPSRIQTPVTDVVSVPDSGLQETTAPSTETLPSDADPESGKQQQLLPEEEKVLDSSLETNKEEEEPNSSIVTLLDTEEDDDDVDAVKEDHRENYCDPLRSRSRCSCAPSLEELLTLRCSKRRCHTAHTKQTSPPVDPPWPDTEVQQLHEGEKSPENGASASEAPPPVENDPDPPALEPSQTSSLPKSNSTDSCGTKPAPLAVETPELPPPEETVTEPRSELRSEDLDQRPDASTSVSAAVELTEEKPLLPPPQADVSEVEPTTGSFQIPDKPSVALNETKSEDVATDDFSTAEKSPASSSLNLSDPSYAEQSAGFAHGSSQKESVFMRLSNRIKALEVNMSLSGRYLEELSQRYRKQMEEMQKAFNQTIIKLQNTSRIAEEQDQRQTDHIHLLQGQLHNITQLVQTLSVNMNEVSDSQKFLLLSLLLCLALGLGLLLGTKHHHLSTQISNLVSAREVKSLGAKSFSYSCSDRQFPSCETGLKRSASFPLIHSESLQLLHISEGSEMLQTENQTHNRKRKRRKLKPVHKVETLTPSLAPSLAPSPPLHVASQLSNGVVLCNVPVSTGPAPLAKTFLQPLFRDSPSEAGSEASSFSDDPSFCGIATSCPQMCDSVPPSRTRAARRRRPKPTCAVVDLLHVPKRDRGEPMATIERLENGRTEKYPGTLGLNVPLPL